MRYLTLTQLRDKLGGRARSSIYNDVQLGRLPKPIKLGGRLYWAENVVDTHLQPELADAREIEQSITSGKEGSVRGT